MAKYVAKVSSKIIYSYAFAQEKEMTTHSSILAWRILWTEEPGGLQFMGSQRAGHDWSDWAHTCAFAHLQLPRPKAMFACYFVVFVIIFSQQIIIPDQVLEFESTNHHAFNDDFSIHGNIFFPGNIFKEHILS